MRSHRRDHGIRRPRSAQRTRQQAAEHRSGIDEAAGEVRGNVEALHERGIPLARAHLDEARRGGVGALGDLASREPEGEQIGDEQEGVGPLERARKPVGGELEEGVERQVLQAVARIELGCRHALVHDVDGREVAVVAVRVRLAQHPSIAQQRVIDGPRVDADRDETGERRTASASPSTMFRYSSVTDQCRPSGVRTGAFGKRATSSRRSSPCVRWPRITRPLVAPRSTAATVPWRGGAGVTAVSWLSPFRERYPFRRALPVDR
ncbi:hypothetical protein GCM10025869_19940 [Homoserinibacter gongjuensis]|uniref:Uncharacterized protein n=1 Tax=Homoserinibacter gongjuensis TaxID=1162968 RepID=A0ABQ6JXF7_9MICO|nr:hypothetical protein GCM10025869_19940 [Homoserinibacter gongjuensis]